MGFLIKHNLLDDPPSKHQWKDMVHSAVSSFWNTKLQAEAEQKTSLKFLNVKNCQIGTTHQVWATAQPHQRDVNRATIKARILTGCYTLQANKAKFNQNAVNPTCLLCKEGAETREHFVSTCKRTKEVRDPYLSSLEETANDIYPGSWGHISSTPHLLTQFILDSTHFQFYPELFTPCEPITRMFLYRLHVVRSTILAS